MNFNYILPVFLKCGLLCEPLDVHRALACEKCEPDNVYNSNSGPSKLFENGLLHFDVNHINIFVSKMMRMLHVFPYYCFSTIGKHLVAKGEFELMSDLGILCC